jgi:hypothetical protein
VLPVFALASCAEPVDLRLAPEVLDVGEVPVGGGGIGTVEVLLASVGPATLALSVEPAGAPFRVLGAPEAGIAQGDHHFVTIEFRPDVAGIHVAALAVEVDAGDARRRVDLELRGTGVLVRPDADRDGWVSGPDCDDQDPSVHPGATETCDGRDEDCDGAPSADELDADGDGVAACDGDCDDFDSGVWPGAPEVCDGSDSDCDGDLPPDELDLDGDTFPPCAGDCADLDPNRHPAQPEFCDGLDTNCDGVLFAEEADADGDGVFPCAGDCDDSDPDRGPGFPELCNALDDDCDGAVPAVEADLDGDGFYACDSDCDDTNGAIHDNSDESCNGVDDDCDGAPLPDEVDNDGDGFLGCEECDDTNPALFPGGVELCDGLDGDCTGAPGVGEVDVDADGYLACEECDDANGDAFPGAPELCNGVDEDCDGLPGAGEHDLDLDGFLACDDCDDGNPETYPGAPEICDRLNNDCQGGLPLDEQDGDADTFAPCEGDCDDGEPAFNPAETDACFDELDQDCDGVVNTGCTCPHWVAPIAPAACGTPGTHGCPHTAVQDAVDALEFDACAEAWILPGTYPTNATVIAATTLVGVGSRDGVVLDGGAAGTVLTNASSLLTLESLTVSNGLGQAGGVLSVLGALEASDVVFRDNHCTGQDAGGVFVGLSGGTFEGCLFEDNSCHSAWLATTGGLLTSGDSTVDGCTFTGNSGAVAGAAYVVGSPNSTVVRSVFLANHTEHSDPAVVGGTLRVSGAVYVANNLVAANTSANDASGLVLDNATPATLIANNVIVENGAGVAGGLYLTADADAGTIQNNVIAGNLGFGVYREAPIWPGQLRFNDVWGNDTEWSSTEPPDNASFDPGFVSWSLDGDPSNDLWALLPSSLSVDAGNPASAWNDPDGSVNDLGLFGGPFGDWAGP